MQKLQHVQAWVGMHTKIAPTVDTQPMSKSPNLDTTLSTITENFQHVPKAVTMATKHVVVATIQTLLKSLQQATSTKTLLRKMLFVKHVQPTELTKK